MDRKTNVMDEEIVKVGVKTNVVDKGLDVFYHPTFYNKLQANDILRQLKTDILTESTECSPLISDGVSLNSSEHKVFFGDKGSTVSKKHMNNGPGSPILMKIRDDIEEALGIRLSLCLADWHKDGHERKRVTMDNEEDVDIGSSIIWMSFGVPWDLLLKHQSFEQFSGQSNLQKEKFSIYKFNFPSGSLI